MRSISVKRCAADRVSLSFKDLMKGEAAGALSLRGGDVLYVR
jgi:polysaccharide export outer membrane protein